LCLSVCLAGPCISPAPTAWICMKFYIGDFYENLKSPNLISIGQKLRALYMGTYVHFIVAGNIKLPYRNSWQHCVAQQCKRNSLLHFHWSTVCMNMSQCYVIYTLPIYIYIFFNAFVMAVWLLIQHAGPYLRMGQRGPGPGRQISRGGILTHCGPVTRILVICVFAS
jgi:hypothetical protein